MYDLIFNIILWFFQGTAKVVVALVSIPIVFFLPRGPGYRHLSYSQTLKTRLKFIAKTIATAFSDNPLKMR